MEPKDGAAVALDPLQRQRRIRRATLTGVALNLSLVVSQVVVGLMANAFSLVADAMHTLADLLADGLVLIANKRGGEPADRSHPYGHGRIETAASLALGAMLVAVGAGFLVAAVGRIERLDSLPPLQPAALWMAALTLLAKEGLFRYLRRNWEGWLSSAVPVIGRSISLGRYAVILAKVVDTLRHAGQPLLVLEAMKMEHTIRAPAAGRVARLRHGEGDLVEEGTELVELEADETGGC